MKSKILSVLLLLALPLAAVVVFQLAGVEADLERARAARIEAAADLERASGERALDEAAAVAIETNADLARDGARGSSSTVLIFCGSGICGLGLVLLFAGFLMVRGLARIKLDIGAD